MRITKAKEKDAGKISNLIKNTINKINAKDYHKKQLEHELSCYTISNVRGYIKDSLVFQAFEGNHLLGVVILDIQKKTLNSLYLKPSKIGKGFGKKLMQFIEKEAKKQGIRELTLYPTKYAEEFYKKLGYKIKRIFKGTENGGFPVTDMRKKLK